MKIGLISCVKTKQNKTSIAEEMYISDLFKKSLKYSKKMYDKIYILSAKYGLIELTDIIDTYELTLNNQSNIFIKKWSYDVLLKLTNKCDINNDIFYFHCGEKYRKYLIQKLKNYKIPLQGLSFGNQLKYYNEH